MQIDGNLDTKINGSCKIESEGEMTLKASKINLKNAYVDDSSIGLLTEQQ
jgi:hypothetical protein